MSTLWNTLTSLFIGPRVSSVVICLYSEEKDADFELQTSPEQMQAAKAIVDVSTFILPSRTRP